MKIIFSKHARKKIREREIGRDLLVKILQKPDLLNYDLFSKTFIAVGEINIMRGLKTNLIISFIKEDKTFKIITSYPCKNLKKELKNKEGIRWVRIG